MLSHDDLEQALVSEPAFWTDGPPYDLFRRLRRECPVHWTERIPAYPEEAGFWSLTTADVIHAVSRDWRTYSSERGGITAVSADLPTRAVAGDVHRHGPTQARPHQGAVPSGVHAQTNRRPRRRDPGYHHGRPRQARRPRDVRPRHRCRPTGRLARHRQLHGDPAGRRRRLGPADERDARGRRHRPQPRRPAGQRPRPRRDRRPALEEHEIVMGFFLLMAGGNDSTKATYCAGMRALIEHPDQRWLLLEDPSLIPSAVEESLRMFPAFAHFRRTATRDTVVGGRQIRAGDKLVMWYVSSNRDEARYDDPDRFDVRRNPDHHAFGAGGRHVCLGAALARLEFRILFEETLARFPHMQLAGEPTVVESMFLNQLKSVLVRLS